MAVYRNDQVDFSFSSEAALGGYFAPLEADKEAVSALNFTGALDLAVEAGSRSIYVDGDAISAISVGEYLIIGADTSIHAGDSDINLNTEIRKVAKVVVDSDDANSGTITLTAPLGYSHLINSAVNQVDVNSGEVQGLGISEDAEGDVTMDHTRFTPGVWESIEVPDPAMEIEGRYFLGTTSKRNFYAAYKGQQSFSGTLSNFELLNGYPLKYPIGKVATKGTDSGAGGGVVQTTAIKPGDYYFLISTNAGYVDGDYVQVGVSDSGLEEVRKIMQIDADTEDTDKDRIWVDYPFLIAHAAGAGGGTCNEVTSPYTHVITETVDLSGITWLVKNTDSSETAANAWLRRYFGGKIGQATITAEEGGTLRMSWESAPFLDMNHNQYISGSTEVNKYDASIKASTVEYPTTEPYYFSQGQVKIMGQEFARVRNFNLSISNGEEPRYYIFPRYGRHRGPTEIREGRRSYGLSCTLALPDSAASASAVGRNTATEFFKQLLMEGNYGSGMEGFNIELTFTRGTSDSIQILIPADYDSGDETTGAEPGLGENGAFLTGAAHPIGGDPIMQVSAEFTFRNLKMVVTDTEKVYT